MPVTRAQLRKQDGVSSRAPPPSSQSPASIDQDPDTPFSDVGDPQASPRPPGKVGEKAVTRDIDIDDPRSVHESPHQVGLDVDGDLENEDGAMAAMGEANAAGNADGNDHSLLPTSQRFSGYDNSVSVLPAKRKRKRSTNDNPHKSRRVQKSHYETDMEGDLECCVEESWNDRILFPNELMLRGGTANAFIYKLVCGAEVLVNYLDVFRTSLKRFITDAVLQVAADFILREKGCTPDEGWVFMHETHLTSAIVENKVFDRKVPSLSRMKLMMNSKVLLIPIQTASSSHWSLLAITNLKSVRSECLKLKPAKGGGYRKFDDPSDGPKALAIHFDSLQQSNHKSASMLFRKFISYCLTEVWKEENKVYYEREKVTPDLRRVVARNLPFLQGKVQQQEDGTTCGWRTVDAVRFMADHKASGTDWGAISKKEFVSKHVDIATRTLRYTQWKVHPSVSDIPSTLFPVNKVLDKVCCSEFECDMETVNKTLATYFKSKSGDVPSSRRNEKKIAMNRKFEKVFAAVAEKMKGEGLDVRRKLNKTIRMKTSHCEAIARYLFPFPRGEPYALSTYYTRNNYPDSILVCNGLSLVLQRNPRVAREYFGSSAARVPKRKRVKHQMAVFLDWTRSKARRWDTNARFRLQELVIHFVGIGEAVLKACCRQAMYNEDNAAALRLQSDEESPPSAEPDGVQEIESDGGGEWSFEHSLTIEDGADENGQIRCSVSPRILGSALPRCITSAEQVGNDAILDCVVDFEKHCKRVLQLSGNVKISEVECYVTGSSMAVIHATFKKKFKAQLLERIRMMWGHVLNEGFIQGSVEPAISRLIDVAEKYFIRNGKLFLNIPDSSSGALLAQPFVSRRKRSGKKEYIHESDDEEQPHSLIAGRSEAPTLDNTPTRVPDTRCFGLGVQTTCLNVRSKPASEEFLALFFYLLQGCRSHEMKETYHCREFASRKWGNDLPECQKLLQDVWATFTASVEKFGKDFDRVAVNGEDATFEDELMKLRFDVVVRAASKVADVSNRSAVNRSRLCQSNVFCYDVPPSYLGDTSVRNGQEFVFSFRGGERDTALWHGSVTEITCESIPHDESGISIAGENAVIGDFPIIKEDPPKLYKLSLDVAIKCMFDFWSDPGQIEAVDKSFLGFRMHECVRLVFAFHNGKSSYVRPDPVTGNYVHSFLAVITSPCTPLGENFKSRNPMVVGPRRVNIEVTVHDDVMQASGCRSSIQDVLERWRKSHARGGTPFSGCYVMPLDDLSLNEDICQYNGLHMSPSLPVPFKLAFFDPSMADAYHEEQKRMQYKAMRLALSPVRADQLAFPPLRKLEDDSKKHIRAAALRCDRGLNQEQLELIQTLLCGWATKETPNGAISMNVCPVGVKEYLRSMGTISAADLKWWGSRSCFIEGPPGTGKTRMLAALIAVILEHLETGQRILIVCETNKALDDIFISVLKLFQGAGCRDRHLKSMVRIGHSKLKVVSNREVHHLRGRSACDAVDKARAVFSTFGSAYRRELSGSSKTFSFVLFDESCLVKQPLALHALTVSYCRSPVKNEDFRRATLVCIGDSKQLHEEDYVNIPVSRKASQHFFNRVFTNGVVVRGNIRMGLRRQYRMNPALAGYISNQFYDGTLLTETDGNLPWKDDSNFRALRRHKRFPIRNVTVVDTSMEGKSGFETLGAGRSYYNSMEIKVIVNVLKAWRDDVGALEIAAKVSIITTYVRQKEELVRSLNAEQLFFPVHTIDEFQGGENDIVIISLVRAGSTSTDDMEFAPSNESAIGFVSRNERVNVALSRAKQGCMVIGNVKHIAKHCESLRNFFAECAQKSTGEEQGSHGYYRLRYVDFKRDLRFSAFTPSYVP